VSELGDYIQEVETEAGLLQSEVEDAEKQF
jgi:hypothetical protein